MGAQPEGVVRVVWLSNDTGSDDDDEVTTTLPQQQFKTAQQFRQGLANAIASDMSASAAAAVDRKPQTTKPQTTKPQTKKLNQQPES